MGDNCDAIIPATAATTAAILCYRHLGSEILYEEGESFPPETVARITHQSDTS